MSEISHFLAASSAVLWSITYVLIIYRGFKDKNYGMPIVALCLNLSWEFIFAAIYPMILAQRIVNYVWFALDVVIVVTYFLYYKKDFSNSLNKRLFIPQFLLLFSTSFLGVLFITIEFDDFSGVYSAFLQNLVMSILFLAMLFRRNNVSGQSIYIALAKMLGTLGPTILVFMNFYEFQNGIFVKFLGIGCLIFDLLYILFLYLKFRELNINPFTHKPKLKEDLSNYLIA